MDKFKNLTKSLKLCAACYVYVILEEKNVTVIGIPHMAITQGCRVLYLCTSVNIILQENLQYQVWPLLLLPFTSAMKGLVSDKTISVLVVIRASMDREQLLDSLSICMSK